MTVLTESPTTAFTPPTGGFAPAPAEARGTHRDAVRMLVAEPGGITHAAFRDLPQHLRAGDVVVVNNSATVPGEIDAVERVGRSCCTWPPPLDDESWILEVRTAPDASRSVLDAAAGDRFTAGGLEVQLLEPYPRPGSSPTGRGNRLWRARARGDLQRI